MPFRVRRFFRLGSALVCVAAALAAVQSFQAQSFQAQSFQAQSFQARPSQALQSAAGADPTAAITTLLTRQAADWSRGDLDAFASGYKKSPDILFIGQKVEHGYAGMLAGYKAHYPTRDAMGVLSFTELAVQGLDDRFATATGHFHLARSAKGGGPADGYFLLVLERTSEGWRIVRDDTSSLPTAPR